MRTFVPLVVGGTVGSCLCMTSYYDPGALTCLLCGITCLTCNNLPGNCTSCDSTTNHRTMGVNNTCICQSGYY
jgi:proprotein convertase subtilisin/kexin type 5